MILPLVPSNPLRSQRYSSARSLSSAVRIAWYISCFDQELRFAERRIRSYLIKASGRCRWQQASKQAIAGENGKAIGFIEDPANKQAVMRSLTKWLRLPQMEGAEELYERMKILYERPITPIRERLQNALRVLGKVNPKIGALKVEDLMDDRIARKLEREGF